MPGTRLIKPCHAALPGYAAALARGWSPDNLATAATAGAHLRRIAEDADGFLASLDDPAGLGPPVRLPDGRLVPRLPGFARWILEDVPQGDAFCGAIGFRWQPGTVALPPHVLGHIGYAIVPWKRGAGHAGRALALLLPELAGLGLGHVTLTTDPGNIASQRVILKCGGRLVEDFRKPPAYGGTEALRFRIDLAIPPD